MKPPEDLEDAETSQLYLIIKFQSCALTSLFLSATASAAPASAAALADALLPGCSGEGIAAAQSA